MEKTLLQNGLYYEISQSADEGKTYAWLTHILPPGIKHIFIPRRVRYEEELIEVNVDFDQFFLSCSSNVESITVAPDHPTLAVYHGNLYSKNLEYLVWISPRCKNCRLPSPLKTLGDCVFFNVRGLESFTVDAGNSTLVVDQGHLYSKDMTTLYCLAPSTEIYDMPQSVKYIAPNAFRHAKSLKTLQLSGNLKEISSSLNSSKELESVILREGIESMGAQTFQFLPVLKTVVLPSSLKTIGNSILTLCPELESLTVPAPEPPCVQTYSRETEIFSKESLSKVKLYVPEESVEKYRQHPVWGEVENILPLPHVPA